MASKQMISLHKLAHKLIKKLGNANPTNEQFNILIRLLSNTIIQAHLLIDHRLTQQETQCLLLAAYGNSIKETALTLDLSIDTVKEYRARLMHKLGCTTIAHAVYQGIRYGYLLTHNSMYLPTKVGINAK